MRLPALRLATLVVFTVCIAAPVPPANAQARRPIGDVLRSLERVRAFGQTAVAPDGRRIAWVERLAGGRSSIYVRPVDGSLPAVRVTASAAGAKAAAERGVAWSPDGQRLAFLSDAASPGQVQVWVTDFSAAPRQLTHGSGQMDHLRWAPDGRQLSLLYVKGSKQQTGALVAYKPDAGVVGDVIEEQRLAVVDPASGRIREVSPANLFVYDYDWSPDGRAFAAEAVEGSGTNNYWTAQLYVVDVATGAARSLWKPPLQIAVPRWSPDGRDIAVIHGIMSDEGANGGDVFLVAADTGQARNLIPALDGSARSLAWQQSGDLLVDEYADGQSVLLVANRDGSTRRRWAAAQQVTSMAVAAKADVVAAVVQSFSSAPEVFAGAPGAWKAMTNANTAIKPAWGEVKSLHWQSDRFEVQGWLMYPEGFDPSRRYPLVVTVHGGPSSAATAGWPSRWNALLPSQGYFVLLPNPRGSYGHGEAFTQANVKDFGYGDLRDILAGVDAAVKTAPIDPGRVGITGWSYGGYMTMWAVTQTDRFKAAVAGAGIVNWQSYYGQNRIDQWMIPFFGASVYADPDVYARSSPITFISKAKTPTLVLHGDRDSEVPTPQGYEFWHALKALGVPTELVIYENEGHAVSRPDHVRDLETRLVGWFDKYLQ